MLSQEDRVKLQDIIVRLSEFAQGTARDRYVLMGMAGIKDLASGLDLSGPPATVAGDVILKVEGHGDLLDRPGYHALGALLKSLLDHRDLPNEDARFIARLIVKYSLVKAPDFIHKLRDEYGAGDAEVSPRKILFQDFRRILLKRVSEDWQKSDAGKLLCSEDSIELDMRFRTDLVDDPRKLEGDVIEQRNEILLPNTEIANVFEGNARKALLIVSARKGGKLTTLLDLKDALVKLARERDEPMPVVIPLRTWPGDRSDEGESNVDRFYEWLILQLTTIYSTTGIDEDAFKAWVESRELILLLYGVEQIDPEYREECIQAINRFLQEQGVAGIVVCSNTLVVEKLQPRLKIHEAVELQSLTPEQIDDYLVQADAQLVDLRTLLQYNEEKVKELRMSPFDLGTMIEAYLSTPNRAECKFVQLCEAVEARRKADYSEEDLEHTFEEGEVNDDGERQRIKDWLGWLAKQMTKHRQNPFYLEDMQPNWLSTLRQQRLHAILTVLVVFLSVGGAAWWAVYRIVVGVFFDSRPDVVLFYGPLVAPLLGFTAVLVTWLGARRISGYWGIIGVGLVCWLAAGLGCWWPANLPKFGLTDEQAIVLGLIGGLAAALSLELVLIPFFRWLARDLGSYHRQIEIVEIKEWTWSKALQGLGLGALFGLFTWLVIDLGRATYQETGYYEVVTFGSGLWRLYGCPAIAGLGLLCFLLFGLRSGTVKLDEKALPNQGIRRSAKHALYVAGSSALAVGLPFVLAHYLYDGPWKSDTLFGLALGLAIGLMAGVIYGGLAWLQHWILRLMLRSKGHIPLDYEGFLDRAVDLKFLEKRGRGYEFRTPWQDFFGKQ
jgi:hypothetical protein